MLPLLPYCQYFGIFTFSGFLNNPVLFESRVRLSFYIRTFYEIRSLIIGNLLKPTSKYIYFRQFASYAA